MACRLIGSLLILTLTSGWSCRRSQEDRRPLIGADGRRHYVSYTADGEVVDSNGVVNIYASTGANRLSAMAASAKPLVYVPNSRSSSVSVIDPATYTVVRTFKTGALPQHVVPSYDLSKLWVLNNGANTLTPIDPVSGKNGAPVRVDDPYNMYYTPDGTFAIVVAEERGRLDFHDPTSMRLVDSVTTQCLGIDHMEFSPDARYAIATCEFNGELVKVDLQNKTAVAYLVLDTTKGAGGAMPQDIRSSADGRVFFVADM